MELILQKCNLTTNQRKIIKDKEPSVTKLLAASNEKLQEIRIPEEILQAFLSARKALSLEECQVILKPYRGK